MVAFLVSSPLRDAAAASASPARCAKVLVGAGASAVLAAVEDDEEAAAAAVAVEEASRLDADELSIVVRPSGGTRARIGSIAAQLDDDLGMESMGDARGSEGGSSNGWMEWLGERTARVVRGVRRDKWNLVSWSPTAGARCMTKAMFGRAPLRPTSPQLKTPLRLFAPEQQKTAWDNFLLQLKIFDGPQWKDKNAHGYFSDFGRSSVHKNTSS